MRNLKNKIKRDKKRRAIKRIRTRIGLKNK
jgi:hypothetical protein